ncbi:hypothetical protein PPROV_000832700 [Pycnococcus provasolii]|uniref:Uncharacterized protein n=1 Tax=Pycnococcus provasolii TaxID=41880 RepID=A0A830HRC0_9CHLO|nr:hypothetical protein PPROV_000832700 [Pycnococcus provasolii]
MAKNTKDDGDADTEEAEDTEEEEDAAQGSNADEWEEEEDASQSGGGGHTLCFGKAVNSFHATGAGSPFGTYYGCELTIDEVTDMLQAAFPRINRNKFDVTCVLFWCLLRGYRLAVKHADAGDALVSCANFLLDEKLYEGQAKKQT